MNERTPDVGQPQDAASQDFFSSLLARLRAHFTTFEVTLALLLILVVVYAMLHGITLRFAKAWHTEGATVDAERTALLLDTTALERELLTPQAIAVPAVDAVLFSLEEAVVAETDAANLSGLFDEAVVSLVNLGLAADEKQANRDSATARITAFLASSQAQAEVLIAAPEDERAVPERLLQLELEQAGQAVVDYMAAPALIVRINTLKEAARGMGYGPESEVILTLGRIAEELEKDRPNRDLAAEMISAMEKEIQGLRTSLFWSGTALRWVEVIAWSLAGILSARLISAGKFIGLGQYAPAWEKWWWAKIVLAPLIAIPVIALLTYLSIDVQSAETLGVRISLKNQPIEVVIAFAFVIGMFSDRAFTFLQTIADNVLPEDDERVYRESAPLVEVPDATLIVGQTLEKARSALEAAGFEVKVESKATGEAAAGTVVARKPEDAKLKQGSAITLVVAATS